MASTLQNGGLMTSPGNLGSTYDSGGLNTYIIKNSYATDIFVGDLVKNGTTGFLQKVTVSTDYPVGVFMGLKPEHQGVFRPAKYFSANASTSAPGNRGGYEALVLDNPNAVFEVQADGSVTIGDIGYNFDVTVGLGNAQYGISTLRLHASSRSAAATGIVKIVGYDTRADNALTDAYPRVLVKLLNHQYDTKTSIA